MMTDERRILLVDDNPQYRAAVTRNLTLADYRVIEAEDSAEGMEKIQTDDPQAIITDLDMRTHDEGLQFIRDVKQRYPKMPIIMISAVGTFDEGALARQYGATFVLSKSRIDAEINTLYQRLDRIFELIGRIRTLQDRVDQTLHEDTSGFDDLQSELNGLLRDEDMDAGMKSEVYDLLDRLERSQARPDSGLADFDERAIVEALAGDLPIINDLDAETRTMVSVAENMQQSQTTMSLSVARNVSFSYSFAVENETKNRIGRKVNRLLSDRKVNELAYDLYDPSLNNLDLFFNQYLIRIVQQNSLELNSEITRQVMERILQHGSKYKPDGLKSLGVILFCWGRQYTFTNRKGKLTISNPLGIKGLPDETVLELASQLILLQHLRNPFIHPEFSDWEKTESVRQAAFNCLTHISKVV